MQAHKRQRGRHQVKKQKQTNKTNSGCFILHSVRADSPFLSKDQGSQKHTNTQAHKYIGL